MIGAEILELHADRVQNALRDGVEATVRISGSTLDLAERRLIDSRLRGAHADLYGAICARSPRREETLRTLASYPGTTIPMSFVRFCDSKRGRGATKVVRKLLGWKPNPVLIQANAPVEAVEFASHQFRVYARLVDPSSADIADMAGAVVDSWNRATVGAVPQ